MTHTFIAENLFVDSPWNHCVTSFGPQDELPNPVLEFKYYSEKILMKDLAGYNTPRGTARKFQHITNLDGTKCNLPLDRWSHPMSDYMDAGLLWMLWRTCYGDAVINKSWETVRPDSFANFKVAENREREYAVKMTHWKDTIHATDDPKFLGMDDPRVQMRMMIYITDPGAIEGIPQMTLWRERGGEKQRFFSYLLSPGFALTYNPNNPEALINFNLQQQYTAEDITRRHQNTWLMYEIIKKD